MRQKLVALMAAAGVACATPVLADPVTITTNGSGIAALTVASEGGLTTTHTYPFTIDGNNAINVSSTAGGTWTTASASITTNLTDLSRMRGSGSTNVSNDTEIGTGEASASSDFFVFFQLAVPHEYRFEGDFATSGGSTSTNLEADWSRWMVHFMAMNPDMSQGSPLVVEQGHDSATVIQSGVLAAGLYRFVVQGTALAGNFVEGPASISAFSNFNFSMDLMALDEQAPVPEPASLLLIGTGLGGIIAARRRRRAG